MTIEDQSLITISKQEYWKLKRDQAWLQALEAAGVDNWEGIDYAYELLDDPYENYN